LDAKALAAQYPDSVELAIWHGRRVAYMGRYHEAIAVFTEALNKWPNDHRLLRHRGHRYITTRQIDKAIADFERAAMLAQNKPNAIEPDGIPNKENRPLGNDKFNIYYHQGLAYYLNGAFDKAVPIYQKCMTVSDNDDLLVATTYWLYMTYHRLGMEAEAKALLEPISADMKLVENDVYLELLLLFKGVKTSEDAMKMPNHPTYQYGIGYFHFLNGDTEEAQKIWKKALTHEAWDAFGYIAAEAEVLYPLGKKSGITASNFIGLSFLVMDDIPNDNCRFDVGCDCCYELLDFHEEGRFLNRIPCVSEMTSFTGEYFVKDFLLTLAYDEWGQLPVIQIWEMTQLIR
jgi:tetratricopeptide (TPR) repeat protein